MALNPGDQAPPFALPDQSGATVALSDFAGRRVLVYLFPKADTPGCTTQSCALRDVAGEVGDTAIVGISPDPPLRQARFDEKYGLGFPLLADGTMPWPRPTGRGASAACTGGPTWGSSAPPSVIDGDGRISHAWPSVKPKDTAPNLLAALAG